VVLNFHFQNNAVIKSNDFYTKQRQMKTLFVYAGILIVSSLLTGCIIVNDDDGPDYCVRGNNNEVIREYSLQRIDGFQTFITGEIYVTQGNEQIIEVEGPANVLDLLEFDVRNGIWEIDTRECFDNADLRFYLTLEDVEYMGISGSADIISTNTLITNDLELDIFGSGDIDIEVSSDDIQVDVVGSGDVFLYGSGDDLTVNIEGSGDFGTFDFTCNRADINISGSGDVEVTVLDHLDVLISGSGDVAFRGFPSVDQHITGTGRIIDAN
jgi:hypothetical protein